MTDDYVLAKINEALSTSGNDRHDAQKLLITWAIRDQQLLLGITKPHLKAIVAALVDHTVRARNVKKPRDTGPDHFPAGEIAGLVATSAPKDRRIPRNIPPPKTTERQASAMRKLAAAFTKKKK